MSRSPWFLLILLLAGLLLSRESRRPGPIGGVDRAFFDWLSANVRPTAGAAGPGVTLVEIDDSVMETPGRWPLSPLDYAVFLQAVQRFEPAVIGIEPIVNWPRAQPANEEILINQALTAPKLLLGAQLGSAQGSPDAAALPPLERVEGGVAGLPEFPEIVAGPSARLFPLAVCGVTNLPAPETPLRELPLLYRRRAEVLPSFALQALGLWGQVAPSEISATVGGSVHLGEGRGVAIDRAGRALLDTGTFREIRRIGLDDLLLLTSGQGPAPTALAKVAAGIKGGLVILGRTDRAMQTYSLPAATAFPPWRCKLGRRPVCGTIQSCAAPVLGGCAGLTVGAAFLGFLLRGTGRGRTFLTVAGALAIYAMTALAGFEFSGLWLPLALPAGLGACLWLGSFLPRGS